MLDHRLFPPKKNPANGFEESFKDDPCLRALAEGRLPNRRYDIFSSMAGARPLLLKPLIFWMHNDGNQGVTHQYTRLSTESQRASLDSIPDWRQKFPHLEKLCLNGDINCEVIHMNVSLELSTTPTPSGSEICLYSEVAVDGPEDPHCRWQAVTSIIRPPELHRDPLNDPPVESIPFEGPIRNIDASASHIRLKLPSTPWAYMLTYLAEFRYSEIQSRTVRNYVEQISMYQDVQSSFGPGTPVTRRGIILWTFSMARSDERGTTTWRYIDTSSPARNACMSPSPHPSQHIAAAMNENFHTFIDNGFQIQHPNVLDPFAQVQSLATPPTTAGLQSPFGGHDYTYPAQPFEMSAESLSFMSHTTIDSGSTLVDNEAANIDNFLSNNSVIVNMGDYDQNGATAGWDLGHSQEAFSVDQTWGNYNVPSNTPQIWEADTKSAWPNMGGKGQGWVEEGHGVQCWEQGNVGGGWENVDEHHITPHQESGHHGRYEGAGVAEQMGHNMPSHDDEMHYEASGTEDSSERTIQWDENGNGTGEQQEGLQVHYDELGNEVQHGGIQMPYESSVNDEQHSGLPTHFDDSNELHDNEWENIAPKEEPLSPGAMGNRITDWQEVPMPTTEHDVYGAGEPGLPLREGEKEYEWVGGADNFAYHQLAERLQTAQEELGHE
jgi:hypothetical protein